MWRCECAKEREKQRDFCLNTAQIDSVCPTLPTVCRVTPFVYRKVEGCIFTWTSSVLSRHDIIPTTPGTLLKQTFIRFYITLLRKVWCVLTGCHYFFKVTLCNVWFLLTKTPAQNCVACFDWLSFLPGCKRIINAHAKCDRFRVHTN